jgi:hypothetical protein
MRRSFRDRETSQMGKRDIEQVEGVVCRWTCRRMTSETSTWKYTSLLSSLWIRRIRS